MWRRPWSSLSETSLFTFTGILGNRHPSGKALGIGPCRSKQSNYGIKSNGITARFTDRV